MDEGERHKTPGQLTEEQIILRSLVRSFLAISNNHVLHSSCRGFISTKAAYFNGQRAMKLWFIDQKGRVAVSSLFGAWRFKECGRNISLPYQYIKLVYITHIHMLSYICSGYSTSQTTVKKDIKKEEAEELKAKLEAVGATIEIV